MKNRHSNSQLHNPLVSLLTRHNRKAMKQGERIQQMRPFSQDSGAAVVVLEVDNKAAISLCFAAATLTLGDFMA